MPCLTPFLLATADDDVTRLILPVPDRIARLGPEIAAEIERTANGVLTGEMGR